MHRIHRFPLILLFSVACCLPRVLSSDGPFDGALPVPADYATGFASITEEQSREVLRTLVDGDMRGRGTGQEGFQKAAVWVSEQLKACGFQPAGENGSWFQNMPFIRLNTLPDQCHVHIAGQPCVVGTDVGISTWNGQFKGQLKVVLAKLGEQRPEIADGQFADCLVVVRGRRRFSADDPWLLKGKPAAVLLVADGGQVRNEAVNQTEQPLSAFPAASVVRTAANLIATACGQDTQFFPEADPAESALVVADAALKAECSLAIERDPIDVPNVIGWYPGSDPAVSHEHICIGAHLDHLGVQRGELYPGADDNGSGSAAIIQIARALHANPIKPRRSVLFIAFCAEERGLLGSRHYARTPTKPLDDMLCMLNIDMIGRDEELPNEPAEQNRNTIHLVGSQLESTGFHQLVLEQNRHVGFVFEYDEEQTVAYRSDQASFADKGIPVSFLFGGFNPYYHKTTDTLDGINFSKIANAARLNYLVLMRAAENGRFTKDVKAAADRKQ
ncbi:MAG: M28 family metallopeptidase [Planctomycetota bacterium]